ncbi:MAG: hypothetical protein AAF383_12045 [Cyanobacteria bacterium P01_A01_bin.83]
MSIKDMVSQLSIVSAVKPDNFNYIKDIYEVCLEKYLNNRNITFSSIDNGRKILQSEKEIDAYIAFYGAQHYYKLESAFNALDILNEFHGQQLNIFSYGCGAATDTCSLISYYRKKKVNLPFKNLTLIEPSQVALQRGVSYVEQSLTYKESKIINIKSLNKQISELEDKDIYDDSLNHKLHIFSNILDIEEINLNQLANLIVQKCRGKNYFICISPKKYNGKARVNEFYQEISLQVNCHIIDINDQSFLKRIYLIKQNNYIDNFQIDRYHNIFYSIF